jgi:hypothetical protein
MIAMCLRTRSNREEWAICSACKRPVRVHEGPNRVQGSEPIVGHGLCLRSTESKWATSDRGVITAELLKTGGDRMVKRKTFPAYGNCSIALATEEMKDGRWAVVVTVTQSTDTAERNTDLPVTHERFASEAEAEAFGLQSAKEWIDRNTAQAV